MVATLYVTSTGAHPIPTPLEVVMSYIDSGWEYYWRNFSVTLAEAGIGYVWGNGIALFLAGLVLRDPPARGRHHPARDHHLLHPDRRGRHPRDRPDQAARRG